jgi:hypothetical protein
MQTRKHTAWKKNRKFGDIIGGRNRLKLDGNIFKRLHNLNPPSPTDITPIFFKENPSRDFYYPANIDEIKDVLKALPAEHTQYLTHIWLDGVKSDDYFSGNNVRAEFICGSNVYLIKLYAVSKNNQLYFGKRKPSNKTLSFYKTYSSDLKQNPDGFYLQFTDETMKAFFLKKLLLHEIGHCIDFSNKRRWSKANVKQVEDFADNYAAVWSNTIKQTLLI